MTKSPRATRKNDAATTRVLIADDHVTVREGLAAIIGRQADMTMVAQAANGREAVDLWQQHQPDVVLLDLRMPLLDGVGAINEIRERRPDARIVVLTTFDSDHELLRAIKAGAKGYMLKDAQRDELLACIRKVHAGGTYIQSSLTDKLAAVVSSKELTERELHVLRLLALGKSNRQIGADLHISETTVKSHLRSVFTKLNVLSRTEALAVASRLGLVQL